MRYCLVRTLAVAAALAASTATAHPQPRDLNAQIEQLQRAVEQLSKTVSTQQKQIDELTRSTAPVTASPQNFAATTPSDNISLPLTQPVQGAGVRSGSYLPDIGLVADIVGTSTQSPEDEEGNDRLSVREVEVIVGHDVDPYSRLDAVLTFSDYEDPEVEEAVVSYWGLPLDSKARIGRMHQRIGKASAAHRDSLDTVDEPLVVQQYFGPEGLFRTGVETSAFTPFSLEDFTQELVLGSMEGGTNEGDLLSESRRHPSIYGHLANFYQFSDTSSLELGGTYLAGSGDDESTLNVGLFGIDATFIHHLSSINRFKLQSELYLQNRSSTDWSEQDSVLQRQASNPFGFYSLADYRLSERWATGVRYDYVEPSVVQEGWENDEQAYSGYLTFFQSEFARWRFEYQRAQLLEGGGDNRFFLQGTFAIGTHKHNIQ